MKNLQTFEEFINESIFFSETDKKIVSKVKTKDDGTSYISVDFKLMTSLVDNSIINAIKKYPDLKIEGLKQWSDYNSGRAAEREEYTRKIYTADGSSLTIIIGWVNSEWPYVGHNNMRYPIDIFIQVYPTVKTYHTSPAIGRGVHADVITKLKDNEIAQIKTDIQRYFEKYLYTVLK